MTKFNFYYLRFSISFWTEGHNSLSARLNAFVQNKLNILGQLAVNFDWFNAVCVQKWKNCANFAPGGRAKRELHYIRLSKHNWASRKLNECLLKSEESNKYGSVTNRRAKSFPATPALWRVYFWDCSRIIKYLKNYKYELYQFICWSYSKLSTAKISLLSLY